MAGCRIPSTPAMVAMTHPNDNQRPLNAKPAVPPMYTLLVSLATLLVFLVVVLSAYLRLAGSGLGCDDWPACYAHYDLQALAMPSVTTTHSTTPDWAMFLHRLIATVLGVLVLGITYISFKRRRELRTSIVIPLLILALTVFLSVLGYQTPAPLWPWVTLSNLLGGMIMLALLWWLSQRSTAKHLLDNRFGSLRPWAIIGLVILSLQIAFGAWTSANFAALACTDFPGCAGLDVVAGNTLAALNPMRTLELSATGGIIMDGSMKTIHMAHRLGAVIVLLYLVWLGLRSVTAGERLRATGMTILVFVCLQVTLGIATVVFGLPLTIVTLHNAVAALLLLAVVNLNHLSFPIRN